MRANSGVIARIVMWAAIAVALSIALISGLRSSFREELPAATDRPAAEVVEVLPPVEGALAVAPHSVSDVSALHIEWAAGSVELLPYDGTTIQFSEDYTGTKYSLHQSVSGKTLSIQFCREPLLATLGAPEKTLTVWVPETGLREIDVETASANVRLDGVFSTEIEISTASGDIFAENLNLSELSLETASGDIFGEGLKAVSLEVATISGEVTAHGEFGDVNAESTSGKMWITATRLPMELECSSVSGDVVLRLPADGAFTYAYDSVSGNVFENHPGASSRRGDPIVEVETVSGDLYFEILE